MFELNMFSNEANVFQISLIDVAKSGSSKFLGIKNLHKTAAVAWTCYFAVCQDYEITSYLDVQAAFLNSHKIFPWSNISCFST